MKLEKILNPVDGSDHAMRATRHAIDLAKMANAEILLLHCHRRFPVMLAEPYFQNAINAIRQQSEDLIAPFVEVLKGSGVSFDTRILEGPAGKMIADVAKIQKVDMIVMGSRGCTDLEGLILGSIAHKVLHACECPVLILK